MEITIIFILSSIQKKFKTKKKMWNWSIVMKMSVIEYIVWRPKQHDNWQMIKDCCQIETIKMIRFHFMSFDFYLITSLPISSVQSISMTLCDPMDHSIPGLPVHHRLAEFTQTYIHWVGDTIQPSHPLSSHSPLTFNLFQPQGLFKWVSSSHQVAKVLAFQLQHQSFQWTPRTDLL